MPLIWLFLGLLTTPVLAQPVVTGTTPAVNQRNVVRTSIVAADFSQPLTASPTTALRVFTNQRGGLRTGNSGTTTVSGSRVTYTPTYDFRPGETVQVVVTRDARSSSGVLGQPRVYQFTTATTATTGGSGIFINGADVPVGDHPYIVTTADVDADGDLDLLEVVG